MPIPNAVILRAPGTNCDVETAFAFEKCGARAERIHLFRLLERPERLCDFQILCIPGGFSYGDDVGAGTIFGQQLRSRLSDALREFLRADKLALGICNGFQVLMKSGILPGGVEDWPPRGEAKPDATLTWNDNGRYTARWVHLAAGGSRSTFLTGIEHIELPVAHAEGKIVVRDERVLAGWREAGQIALRYQPGDNPNGSTADIAGLCDPTGRVLGLMPHPERHIHATQHPQWTRRKLDSEDGAGLTIFRNAVRYFA
ncbi:MAG TPA: phosphoribosylformylglycinamidine synthase subunit PurQ [Planctomycetaceae bacterium]|nr:phosphoribosylformylglycinamidine synthase subunit PurQ [Planctomycetaceae bacterium]